MFPDETIPALGQCPDRQLFSDIQDFVGHPCFSTPMPTVGGMVARSCSPLQSACPDRPFD
jgi:hypothetical protein